MDSLMYFITSKLIFTVIITNEKIDTFFIIVSLPFILRIALLSLISDLYSDKCYWRQCTTIFRGFHHKEPVF